MEFSKRKVFSAAAALGLGGVVLGVTNPNFSNEAAPNFEQEQTKLQCAPHRLEEWQPVAGHMDSEQINRVVGGLRVSAERVAKGRVGYAICNRPMTEQEEERGVPAKLPNVDQACFLLGNAVVLAAESAAYAVCTDVPVNFRGPRAF